MNWVAILNMIMYILGKLKDSDGDGRLDVFDGAPNDPEVK